MSSKLRRQIEEVFGNEAAALADRQQLARQAHQLVTHAALLGFSELSQLCIELEEACTSGQDVAAPFQQAKAAGQIADRSASGTHPVKTAVLADLARSPRQRRL
ncbi:Hpt domain-containing protein [Aurantimonas sp. A2-1-M11]|uniref:Hpt domain-containing protein n=1 Tax=Aurantimonas sp. A2-1-M11 TaxID=3113712 RepID=UPI002F9295F8